MMVNEAVLSVVACPACRRRYAVAVLAPEFFGVWYAERPYNSPVASMGAADVCCIDCLYRGEIVKVQVVYEVAAFTANKKWIDLSATLIRARGEAAQS